MLLYLERQVQGLRQSGALGGFRLINCTNESSLRTQYDTSREMFLFTCSSPKFFCSKIQIFENPELSELSQFEIRVNVEEIIVLQTYSKTNLSQLTIIVLNNDTILYFTFFKGQSFFEIYNVWKPQPYQDSQDYPSISDQ